MFFLHYAYLQFLAAHPLVSEVKNADNDVEET